jgi:hypothetical protein
MSATSVSIRIRPLRLGFLIDPTDRVILRHVLQVNTCLWGGIYNYLLPVPKTAPARYRDYLFTGTGPRPGPLKLMAGTGPSAQEFVDGLLETFQPDLLVETAAGLASKVRFDERRIISLSQFNELDGQRRNFGIDLRSICRALYDETFRFVQRHPPSVIEPRSKDKKYELFFASVFGEFPTTGSLAGCQQHFRDALDAKERIVEPAEFHKLFLQSNLYPLRVGVYELATYNRGHKPDPMLFYMDERKPYDIIEYWNLRALGWRIWPLPRSFASKMTQYCEDFIERSHRAFPPPSNAWENASFLCSRSCRFDEMQEYVSTLKNPKSHFVSIDPRFPRLWAEWGRNADHAEPQTVEYKTEPTNAFPLGGSIAIGTVLPEFMEDRPLTSNFNACTNVFESLPGGAPVIPWQTTDMRFLTGHLRDENIWLGREGICTTAGAYRTRRHLRLPSSFNVFAAWAQNSAMEIELSPAGRVAEQVIKALGGLNGVWAIGSEELIKVFDRMANGTLEVEVTGEEDSKKRRLRKGSVPLFQIRDVLKRARQNNPFIAENTLSALLGSDVLALGMDVLCSECGQTTWFALEHLGPKLKCGRCLREFNFPLTEPQKNSWSYRVQGPFAVENFAHGAYCVAFGLLFLAEKVSRECTWIPSFKLRRAGPGLIDAEADFGAFVKPGRFSHFTDPVLFLGECKTFGEFDSQDYRRMKTLAKLFPGAATCFCTLRRELTATEKKKIAALARRGRKTLKTGQWKNPVLVLTGHELLGQFKGGAFTDGYPSQFVKIGDGAFMRGDLQEICNFMQQVHLGMESYHAQLEAESRARRAKSVVQPETPASS